jgi:protease I
MSAKKILMIVGDYVEDYEVMVPFQMLLMVGHTVHAVCPNKSAGETVATAIHDFEGDQTYSEKRGHNFRLNKSFKEVKAADYDALVLPGGRAPEYLRLHEEVLKIVREMMHAGKPCASICHGAQILVAAGVLKDRVCCAYPAVKPDVVMAGAKWGEPGEGLASAHADKNLVTAAAWTAHPSWMREFLRVLESKIEP